MIGSGLPHLGILGIRAFQDEVGAGTWLKPGAWECRTTGRSYAKRRGFRPAMGVVKTTG